MTGAELRTIREARGLSLDAMGRALGYTGSKQTNRTTIYRYERGLRRPIPPRVILKLIELGWYKPPRSLLAASR